MALARRTRGQSGGVAKVQQLHVAAPKDSMDSKEDGTVAPVKMEKKAEEKAVLGLEKAVLGLVKSEVEGEGVKEKSAPVGLDSPGPSVGLVSNASLTEHEVAEFWLSADAVSEEDRLATERQKTGEKEEAAPKMDVPLVLETKQFDALEDLLNKTDMFSMFLAEQMKSAEERTAVTAATAAAAAAKKLAAKGKGTKRGRAGAANKKADDVVAQADAPAGALTPTQAFLPLMTVEMRDYQLTGVKWLDSLYQNGANGILADQMGLGKTIQTIGFLSLLKGNGMNGPFLVVGPLSTLPNWVNEFARFCPGMPALLYHGSKSEREELRRTKLKLGANGVFPDNYPVIVTSFEIIIADTKFFQKTKFKYLVVDEGHRLKNFQCKLLRELKLIPAANRLLLSGTPLQNNLSELWSLLNFIMPDIFSSLADFEAWFDFSSMVTEGADENMIAAEQRACTVSKLHNILKPFVLRRLKSDVEISLPGKMEVVMYASMTEAQEKINKQLLDKSLLEEMTQAALEDGVGSGALGNLNNVLMQMRKNCNHPDLITSAFTRDMNYPAPEEMVAQCGKLALLDRLLKRLHGAGHKVLIFSQMTKMMDLLQSYLSQQGHNACRIDGSVKWQDRQQSINDFNSDPNTWVFLLSTRAGGLGINLTAADTCIIYDSDWNPHADLQAMDRCHRIGQTKPVLVFRLATANSVEGKMLKRAASKVALEKLVIKKGAFKMGDAAGSSSSMSAAELLELLRSGATKSDLPQSGEVSDADLDKLLDRAHLELGSKAACRSDVSGVGFERVLVEEGASMLSNIT